MPTYSYRCRSCEVAFEVQQDFTEDSLTSCRSCGGALRKLFSAVGVSFQGTGFYRTDSRAENKTSSPAENGKKEKPKGTQESPSKGAAKKEKKP